MKSNRRPEDPKPSVPAYIVTFSDMITLLLTFFVLLLSLAEEQDKTLFKRGQSSFKNATADFGLSGVLFSKAKSKDFNHAQVKHKINKGNDDRKKRSVDAQTELLRRTIMNLERSMDIMPSQIKGYSKNLTIPEVHFKKSSWALDDSSREYFKTYCAELQESFAQKKLIIYVVGFAGGERTEKQQWLVSANRASQVADFMGECFGGDAGRRIYSWGAGSGGDWCGPEGVAGKNANILLTVLAQDQE
ncbi:MAG: hypothetical protein E4H40_04205 [Candidatus Brocadiia bacterium]|nr:MAG: hypothetical protein E4H40_04205 [Candidatus Brocadiia bacterium]